MRCKIKDTRVLDFYHRNEQTKLFTIGSFRRSVGFNRIRKEVKQCKVLCTNCHRIFHDETRKMLS